MTRGRNRLFKLFQIAVIAFAVSFLYDRLSASWTWEAFRFRGEVHLLLLAMALMPLNWSLETAKWMLLSKKAQPLSFTKAARAVLTGCFYGLFTPNRAGELAGRLHFAGKGQNTRTSYAFFNGSVAQTLATLLAGSVALALIPDFITEGDRHWWVMLNPLKWLVWILTAALVLIYTEPGWLTLLKGAFPPSGFIGRRLQMLQESKRSSLYVILLISILRYAIFSIQFFLLLLLFGYDGSALEAFLRIGILYLATTLIPTVALAELGLRESLALMLFLPPLMSPSAAFAATFILWVINLLLPAVIGGFIFAQLRNLQET